MPTESIVFSPEISERDLDREVAGVNDQLEDAASGITADFDADMDALTPPGGGGGLSAGGSGMLALAENRNDLLVDIRESLQEDFVGDDDGGGGGGSRILSIAGGGAAAGGGASIISVLGLGGAGTAAAGGLLSTPTWLSDLWEWQMQSPDWLSDITGFDIPEPSWFSVFRGLIDAWEMQMNAMSSGISWVEDLVGFELPEPWWLSDFSGGAWLEKPNWMDAPSFNWPSMPRWMSPLSVEWPGQPDWMQGELFDWPAMPSWMQGSLFEMPDPPRWLQRFLNQVGGGGGPSRQWQMDHDVVPQNVGDGGGGNPINFDVNAPIQIDPDQIIQGITRELRPEIEEAQRRIDQLENDITDGGPII